MHKVYISPSSQFANVGLAPFTTEGAEMTIIGSALMKLIANDGRLSAKCSQPEMTDCYAKAKESNDFGADIHVAIHSNAGGGKGTEVFAYGAKTNSERLATALYAQIAPLSPGEDRGVKFNPGLIEVGDCVKATSALIELGFHDNAADAQWLATDIQQIAKFLYHGICDYFGYGYRDQVSDSSPVDKDIYLSVRVLQSKAAGAITNINALGFAAKVLDLA